MPHEDHIPLSLGVVEPAGEVGAHLNQNFKWILFCKCFFSGFLMIWKKWKEGEDIEQMREMSCWWHFLLHIFTIGSSEKEGEGKLELMQRWKELGWRWQLRISTESRGDPILTIGSSERKPRSSRVFKVFGSPSLEKCFTLLYISMKFSSFVGQSLIFCGWFELFRPFHRNN